MPYEVFKVYFKARRIKIAWYWVRGYRYINPIMQYNGARPKYIDMKSLFMIKEAYQELN